MLAGSGCGPRAPPPVHYPLCVPAAVASALLISSAYDLLLALFRNLLKMLLPRVATKRASGKPREKGKKRKLQLNQSEAQ